MSLIQLVLLSLTIISFFKTANAAVGTPCTNGGGECVAEGEVCDTGVTDKCKCDTDNNYAQGPVTTTSCFRAVDLGSPCTAVAGDECKLGNGGMGAICSATKQCDCDQANSYVKDAGTCKKNCGNPTNSTGYIVTVGQGAAATLEGATATVTCATGYTGTPPNVTCQDSGTWTTPSGCSLSSAGGIGAGMIRQQFGLIVLIGVLFRAFM